MPRCGSAQWLVEPITRAERSPRRCDPTTTMEAPFDAASITSAAMPSSAEPVISRPGRGLAGERAGAVDDLVGGLVHRLASRRSTVRRPPSGRARRGSRRVQAWTMCRNVPRREAACAAYLTAASLSSLPSAPTTTGPPAVDAWCTTATGQRARWRQSCETDPRTSDLSSPRPREPITSRSASAEASHSTSTVSPAIGTGSIVMSGATAAAIAAAFLSRCSAVPSPGFRFTYCGAPILPRVTVSGSGQTVTISSTAPAAAASAAAKRTASSPLSVPSVPTTMRAMHDLHGLVASAGCHADRPVSTWLPH